MERATYNKLWNLLVDLEETVDSAIAQLKEIKRREELENRKLTSEETESIRTEVEKEIYNAKKRIRY